MPPDKSRAQPSTPSLAQLQNQVKSLQDALRKLQDSQSQLHKVVAKHKDILQVQDNWFSHVSKWVGKKIVFCLREIGIKEGVLEWADRYHVGIYIDGDGTTLFNKGQIIFMRLKEE